MGENISLALKREFGEEALNTDKFPHKIYIQTTKDYFTLSLLILYNRKKIADKLFSDGKLLYQGYVDDPRNTDNAWMETQGNWRRKILNSD